MIMQLYDFEGGKIWLDPDASTMQALMVETRWEWRKVDYMRRHLKPGMAFADVGAFNGYFTLIAAKLVGETGQVFAFEPDADCMEWLEMDMAANNLLLKSNIVRYFMAVGSTEQPVSMFKGEQLGFTSTRRQSDTVFLRPQVRIDTTIPNRLDMMKIDVEGSELNVLRGAEITLFAAKHCHILLDLHPELGVTPEGVEDFLLTHGFKLFDIRSDFAPLERIPGDLVELLAVK
jgi:FkbM family methyltransferase